MRRKVFSIVIGLALIAVGSLGLAYNKDISRYIEHETFIGKLDRSPISLVFRDLYIASMAHNRAGDPIPFELIKEYDGGFGRAPYRIDYVKGNLICPYCSWGIRTNSEWLAEFVRYVVPFYEYEGIAPPNQSVYPIQIAFFPLTGDNSFHLLGSAATWYSVVNLNERMLLKPNADLRQIYSTIIHELVHTQRGGFSNDRPNIIEPKTQSATLEVLAAMCNYGDDVACKAFWYEVESWARGSLWVRLRMIGLDDLYQPLANLLWRDADQEAAADKSLRHWFEDEEAEHYLWDIIYNYEKYPWEVHVIPGICGQPMDTGQAKFVEVTSKGDVIFEIIGMLFDDTASMFPWWVREITCALPYGPQVP